ncbi:ATP-grasp fold amidoligase family protein [Vagococcus lutrae]|uniref:ATP-grasp fold amidoligase family protein n=1 Tax=Vagococcus lutrae TaxID=81947 RepID=UPI00288E74BE|nr:ATP-grasp fold amidoligase family protein [Vagococcus lutrae]MDT2811545.1 ATP-grasp fold amidoligase family protein [Vagococcus lutrae]
MNYKKIIKSRDLRIKLMRMLSFIPDKFMIFVQYRLATGRKLNLKKPIRYTEKLQWYKLYYRDPLMGKCADKFEVRSYVESKGLKDILVPLIGIYDTVDEITFDKLPNQFVIKDTLGGGGHSVILVKDKKNTDIEQLKLNALKWIKESKGKNPGREWVYDNKKNRIIIEKFIDSNENQGGLVDYKFFCFNGKVEYVYVITDRKPDNNSKIGIYNRNFERLPFSRYGKTPLTKNIQKPEKYEEMIKISEILSKDFPHARIDLYNSENKILFGEITFFNGSGYILFEPDEFDYILGEKFILPN